MSATIYALTAKVREAALDARAVQKRIAEGGGRGHEWRLAHASARARMIALSRQHADDPMGQTEHAGASPDRPPGAGTVEAASIPTDA